MTYTAYPYHNQPHYAGPWYIGPALPEYLTEGQAKVIAWALNAVAAGGTLESKRIVGRTGEPPHQGNVPAGTAIFEITTYDGPSLEVEPAHA